MSRLKAVPNDHRQDQMQQHCEHTLNQGHVQNAESVSLHQQGNQNLPGLYPAVAKAEQQRLRDGAFFRAKQKALEQKAKALFEHTGGKADEHHSQNRVQRAEHGKPHAVIQQPQQRDTQQRL